MADKMTPTADTDRASAPPAGTPTVFEAIVKQQALAATYNNGSVTIAPHVVYTKHGEIYVDALTIERDGKPPKEAKIGAFKVAGLGGLRVTPRRFEPSALFNASDARYDGVTLLAVNR